MRIGIYAQLDRSERQALTRLAEIERRDPRQQAALLIRRELERAGLIEPRSPRLEAAKCQSQ